MSEEQVTVTNVSGSQSADINVTGAEAAAADAAAKESEGKLTAESLGVTEQQFTKYYNAETNAYNWQAHAVEADYRASQQKPKADSGAAENAGDAAAGTGEAGDAEAKTAVEAAGLDFAVLEQQVIDGGDIDEASYEALKKIGIPEDVVKSYIESVKATAEGAVAEIMAALGGEQDLAKIKAYCAEKYTEDQKLEIDKALANPTTMEAMAARLRSEAGLPPKGKSGGVTAPNATGAGDGSVAGYKTQAEMVADMRNPKYRTDPAFRAQVEAKARAAQFGMNPRAHTSGL